MGPDNSAPPLPEPEGTRPVTAPETRSQLPVAEVIELTELLPFIDDWLTTCHDQLTTTGGRDTAAVPASESRLTPEIIHGWAFGVI